MASVTERCSNAAAARPTRGRGRRSTALGAAAVASAVASAAAAWTFAAPVGGGSGAVSSTSRAAAALVESSPAAAAGYTAQRPGLLSRNRLRSRKALPGAQLLADSGALETAAGIWLRLVPYPPFSWMQWAWLQVVALPRWWKVYMFFSLGSSFAKMLIPGLYNQLVTGTWLSILSIAAPPIYEKFIVQRLTELLQKQAALRQVPGQPRVQLSQATVAAVETQLKDNPTLLEALGSVPVLGYWHRLEKYRLDSPEVLEGVPESSQLRWVVEALRGGYLDDLEATAASTNLGKAATDAGASLQRQDERRASRRP
eukprot:TRINITY_DN15309_c0_g1_i1.p1 TRINITY_DN15309_c0_g1~~TRINITY_DN15309_c0_g1_i1.p1  ORF type:complete len:313 (+),score=79.16 TRINITY_DN15309_c0_g1_i1:101-1039(+)